MHRGGLLEEYLPGDEPAWGVYLPGGVPAQGGVPSWGGLPGQVLPPVDRQTHVKTSTSQTLFAGGNNRKRLTDFNKNACACGKYHWLATPVPWLGVRQLSSEGVFSCHIIDADAWYKLAPMI